MPNDWLQLTTHRLDIYNEEKAKVEFLDELDRYFASGHLDTESLNNMPTSYDYIRLGHPLSCLLEWSIAKMNKMEAERVIAFSSQTMPILAVLRKNLLEKKKTRIVYKNELPHFFDSNVIKDIYGYSFELHQLESLDEIEDFNGCTICVSQQLDLTALQPLNKVDFYVYFAKGLGSVIIANSEGSTQYISEIQHVRRRETIAMTPADTH